MTTHATRREYAIVTIGRGDASNVRLEDATVSRRHAELVVTPQGKYFLTACRPRADTRIWVYRKETWEPFVSGYVERDAWVQMGEAAPVKVADLAGAITVSEP